jgi:pimeloyl-ACP methyl ester carboxylesterase
MKGHPRGFATLEEAGEAVAAYNPHRYRTSDASGLINNLRRREDGRLYWHWDPRMLHGMDHSEPPNFADRLNHAAARVRVPTLLVRGLLSDVVSTEGVAEFQQHMRHLEVFEVAGAGHMVAGDRNDAFNQGVFDFLRRCTPAGQDG